MNFIARMIINVFVNESKMRVASTCITLPPMLLEAMWSSTQDYDGGYDEPYVEREHKLQPHLDIGCHTWVKACFITKVKIEPSNELDLVLE